jgi:entericidin B
MRSTHPETRSLAMNTNLKRLLSLAVLLGSLSLTACNTVEGAGKDIEAAGEEIQEEADENK